MNRNECEEIASFNDAETSRPIATDGLIAHSALSSHQLNMRDYLIARENLKYDAMYFPLGFPLRVISNSPAIFAVANQSWSVFHPVFHREPLELLLKVCPDANEIGTLPPAPTHMQKGDVLLHVSDSDNFFVADLKRGRALVQISQTTARSEEFLRYHFLEAAALCMVTAMRAVPIHGACVRVSGRGILICGDSGEGKSTLAYAGSRAGWTYISDDATYLPLDREDRLAVGNCYHVRFRPSAVALFPELAGLSLTPRAAGKPSIEVRTARLPVTSTASAAFIDHIVFLNRKCLDTQDLISLNATTVWPWFKQNLMSTSDSRPAQEATLTRLLSVGISELRYRDLDWAIDRVRQLAMKGY
jgi:hypothetical protein